MNELKNFARDVVKRKDFALDVSSLFGTISVFVLAISIWCEAFEESKKPNSI